MVSLKTITKADNLLYISPIRFNVHRYRVAMYKIGKDKIRIRHLCEKGCDISIIVTKKDLQGLHPRILQKRV